MQSVICSLRSANVGHHQIRAKYHPIYNRFFFLNTSKCSSKGLLLWSSVTVICKIMIPFDNHGPVDLLFYMFLFLLGRII